MAETLVALSLGGLALGIIIYLLLAAMRVTHKGTARVELQQAAATCERRLARDLAGAPVGGLTVVNESEEWLLSIHPLEGVSGQGRQQWSDTLIVYRWEASQSELRRTVVSVGPRDLPLRPGAVQLRGWAQDPTLATRVLAQEVALVELTSTSPGVLEQPLRLVMVLERRGGAPEPERFRLEREFFLLNTTR